MTENEKMSPKEVKNSEKKNCEFFCDFFFFWNLFDCKFISNLNMDHWINKSMNQWKCKNELNNCLSKIEKLWKSAKKGTFDFLNSPIYEFMP